MRFASPIGVALGLLIAFAPLTLVFGQNLTAYRCRLSDGQLLLTDKPKCPDGSAATLLKPQAAPLAPNQGERWAGVASAGSRPAMSKKLLDIAMTNASGSAFKRRAIAVAEIERLLRQPDHTPSVVARIQDMYPFQAAVALSFMGPNEAPRVHELAIRAIKSVSRNDMHRYGHLVEPLVGALLAVGLRAEATQFAAVGFEIGGALDDIVFAELIANVARAHLHLGERAKAIRATDPEQIRVGSIDWSVTLTSSAIEQLARSRRQYAASVAARIAPMIAARGDLEGAVQLFHANDGAGFAPMRFYGAAALAARMTNSGLDARAEPLIKLARAEFENAGSSMMAFQELDDARVRLAAALSRKNRLSDALQVLGWRSLQGGRAAADLARSRQAPEEAYVLAMGGHTDEALGRLRNPALAEHEREEMALQIARGLLSISWRSLD